MAGRGKSVLLKNRFSSGNMIMQKKLFILIIIFSLILNLNGFFIYAQEHNQGLKLELLSNPWQNIQSGEERIANLKITNQTGHSLQGSLIFFVEYQGVCTSGKTESLEGPLEIIYPYFKIGNSNWLLPISAKWENGETTFTGFEIPTGQTLSQLKIKTNPALCPGQYTFIVSLEGYYQGQQYQAPPTIVGGSGAVFSPPLHKLIILNQSVKVATTTQIRATLTWRTNYPATSQVIYALQGESHTLNLGDNIGSFPYPPKYGYAHTTLEYDVNSKVKNHLVTITGLIPGKTYYYRCVSHGSLAISQEFSFTTLAQAGEAKKRVAIQLPSGSNLKIPSAKVVPTKKTGQGIIVRKQVASTSANQLTRPAVAAGAATQLLKKSVGFGKYMVAALSNIVNSKALLAIVILLLLVLLYLLVKEAVLQYRKRRKKKEIS